MLISNINDSKIIHHQRKLDWAGSMDPQAVHVLYLAMSMLCKLLGEQKFCRKSRLGQAVHTFLNLYVDLAFIDKFIQDVFDHCADLDIPDWNLHLFILHHRGANIIVLHIHIHIHYMFSWQRDVHNAVGRCWIRHLGGYLSWVVYPGPVNCQPHSFWIHLVQLGVTEQMFPM
jgi:hypothetical protein